MKNYILNIWKYCYFLTMLIGSRILAKVHRCFCFQDGRRFHPWHLIPIISSLWLKKKTFWIVVTCWIWTRHEDLWATCVRLQQNACLKRWIFYWDSSPVHHAKGTWTGWHSWSEGCRWSSFRLVCYFKTFLSQDQAVTCVIVPSGKRTHGINLTRWVYVL